MGIRLDLPRSSCRWWTVAWASAGVHRAPELRPPMGCGHSDTQCRGLHAPHGGAPAIGPKCPGAPPPDHNASARHGARPRRRGWGARMSSPARARGPRSSRGSRRSPAPWWRCSCCRRNWYGGRCRRCTAGREGGGGRLRSAKCVRVACLMGPPPSAALGGLTSIAPASHRGRATAAAGGFEPEMCRAPLGADPGHVQRNIVEDVLTNMLTEQHLHCNANDDLALRWPKGLDIKGHQLVCQKSLDQIQGGWSNRSSFTHVHLHPVGQI